MPFYDCMLLLRPHVSKEGLMDLVARVGKHVYRRNGVLTDIKSFGVVQLGYGIKKLDGRQFKGQLMQISMIITPNFNKELHYLNKEDRLLRWLLVKQRKTNYGMYFLDENNDANSEMNELWGSSSSHEGKILAALAEEEDDDDDDDYEEL